MLSIITCILGLGLSVQSRAQAAHVAGAVFAMTNNANNNEVVVYTRAENGALREANRFATGGRGSGGTTDPLESQGSLTLTEDHSLLLAVNAGSGEISVFQVHGTQLNLVSKVPCGGSEPVSIAQHNGLVYVANAGGNSNVNGFRLKHSGELTPIAGSISFLSVTNSGPGSVSFSPDGQFLLVTEEITNSIDVFPVQSDGKLGPIVVNPSAGPGAFAVLFAPNGAALVSQTGPMGATNASAISSYAVQSDGTLSAISANVPTMATATCWQVVTPDGKFVYTSNPGSGTISGFSIAQSGALTPLPGTVVATLPTGSANLDVAISADGKFLYTLDSGTGRISILGINSDGSLQNVGQAGGLQANSGVNGIAAI
jgi:6-phosphogluconolactonase (cycloisomerase 2 family)